MSTPCIDSQSHQPRCLSHYLGAHNPFSHFSLLWHNPSPPPHFSVHGFPPSLQSFDGTCNLTPASIWGYCGFLCVDSSSRWESFSSKCYVDGKRAVRLQGKFKPSESLAKSAAGLPFRPRWGGSSRHCGYGTAICLTVDGQERIVRVNVKRMEERDERSPEVYQCDRPSSQQPRSGPGPRREGDMQIEFSFFARMVR